jgi:hypothetical protein
MYFYGRRAFWQAQDRDKQDAIAALFPELCGKDIDVEEIKAEFKYWRKFNALHAWFVNNVQDGVDECQEIEVPVEKLHELRDVCAAVLASPDRASELLPTCGGFFFGHTDYDEWYFHNVKETLQWLNGFLLKETFDQFKGWCFYYRSSW